MWSWLPATISAIVVVLKALFGIDKPQQVTTNEKPSPLPAPDSVDVLRDLGIASSATADRTGFRQSVDPRADTLRLHIRADSGSPTRADPPRSTPADFGERDSDR